MVRRILTGLLSVVLFAGIALAATEICGDGVDNDASGTAGSCPGGSVDAIYSTGCDELCAAPDQDADGYATSGYTGPNSGVDCDDTRRDIYPGISTDVGCSAGSWRTCQSDGTFTSCSSSDWCPSACTAGCKYINRATGNNSNAGTKASPWHNHTKFTYNGGGYTPSAGECFVFFDGTYSETTTYNSYDYGWLWNVDGDASNHIGVYNYPGEDAVYLDAGGTSGAPKMALACTAGCSYIDWQGVHVTGNYCNATSEIPDAGCMAWTVGPNNIVIRNTRFENNQCPHDINCSSLLIHDGASPINVHHNYFFNTYDPAESGENVAELTTFRTDGLTVVDNVGRKTDANRATGMIFKINKHASAANAFEVKRNRLQNGSILIGTGGQSFSLESNVLTDCDDKAFWIKDYGGTSHFTGTMDLQYNTIINCRPLRYRPSEAWNANGSSAADVCSGDETLGTFRFRWNVIDDNSSYNGAAGELNVLDVDRYGPDGLYTAVIGAGKFVSTNNCYLFDNTPYFQVYGSNGGTSACNESEQGLSGASYANWAAWTGAGYDASSFNEDPTFDGDKIATSSNCLNKGWNVGLYSATGDQTTSGAGTFRARGGRL